MIPLLCCLIAGCTQTDTTVPAQKVAAASPSQKATNPVAVIPPESTPLVGATRKLFVAVSKDKSAEVSVFKSRGRVSVKIGSTPYASNDAPQELAAATEAIDELIASNLLKQSRAIHGGYESTPTVTTIYMLTSKGHEAAQQFKSEQ